MIPLPDPARLIELQDSDILLAMTLFGESRGESREGKLAVGYVIRNRVTAGGWFGKTWQEVILKPLQFSCFNANDPNRAKLLHPLAHEQRGVWDDCYAAAVAVMLLGVELQDPTGRATHYLDASLDDSPARPAWVKKLIPTIKIGRLRFFRDPKAFQRHEEARPEEVPD